MRLKAAAATTVILGALLAGCSDDKPAVCESVDKLQSSVDDVKDIDPTASGALSDFEDGLSTIKNNLADVKSEAESEFSSQIDAVDTAFTGVQSSVDAAKSDPSAETLSAVGTAISAFDTAFETLTSDVKSTC